MEEALHVVRQIGYAQINGLFVKAQSTNEIKTEEIVGSVRWV